MPTTSNLLTILVEQVLGRDKLGGVIHSAARTQSCCARQGVMLTRSNLLAVVTGAAAAHVQTGRCDLAEGRIVLTPRGAACGRA